MNQRPASVIVLITASVIFALWFARGFISSQALPSLQEYLASTTPNTSDQPASASATSTGLSTNASTSRQQSPDRSSNLKMIAVHAPKGLIPAEVASSSAEQELGLSNRASLPADQGMLFTFRYPGDYGFWMKDMHFPIDMIWVLSNKKVAGITAAVPADSYPSVFYPPLAISYVLELNAGAAEKFGIATGTQLTF